MILVQRTIPFFFTVFAFALWESSLFFKERYLVFFAILVVLTSITVAQLTRWQIFSRQFFAFYIGPLFFTVAAILFLLFVEDFLMQQLLILLHVAGSALYFESCFAYLYHAKGYQPYALQNTASLINLASVLLFYSAVFAFFIFFQTPFWILFLAISIFTLFSVIQTFWIHKISVRTNKLFVGIIVFILLQLFVALRYLPVSWLVSGMSLGVFYYIILHLSKYHLLKSFNRAVAFRYLAVGVVVLASLFGTAQWI